MSESKEKVKKYLEEMFDESKIHETDEGFKFNIAELDQHDINYLNWGELIQCSLKVKRSGTGVVVVVRCY